MLPTAQPPENEILELFSEDLRVPGTFSWPLWLFSTFAGRKSLKWRSMTLYNQKWSCNIGVPVDPHFLFIPQEYKLFLHFNLITISVIYSLTNKTPKIQQQASVVRWQAQRQLLLTMSNSCPFQRPPLASQPTHRRTGRWLRTQSLGCSTTRAQLCPAQIPCPAPKGNVLEKAGTLACLQVKNVPLAKPEY